MEDLTREELQDLMYSYEDYVMTCREDGEEPYSLTEYYINLYEKPIPTLKGVGVTDTEKGIKIILMSTSEELVNSYEVETNMSGYSDIDLCKICYNISQKVHNRYYEEKGNLTQEQVLEIVRNELVK